MRIVQTTAAVFLSLCLLLLSCGSYDPGPLITYEVTGATIRETGVEYHNEYGDKERFSSVRLPWVKSFYVQFRGDQYPGGAFHGDVFPAYVSAWIADRTGYITVSIYVDGKLAQTTSIADTYEHARLYCGVRLGF
jgi:hypothetical protein